VTIGVRIAGVLCAIALLCVPGVAHAEDDACLPGIEAQTARPEAFAQLGIEKAQTVTKGKNVTVAVISTGLDRNNPHLHDASYSNPGDIRGVAGIGSQVAGVIAARETQAGGLVGVAPDAKILAIQLYDGSKKQGQEAKYTATQLANAVQTAVREKAKIIVIPENFNANSKEAQSGLAALSSEIKKASKSALIITSTSDTSTANTEADKNNTDPQVYPASYDAVLTVTAVGAEGKAEAATTRIAGYIDIAAPGAGVLTAASTGSQKTPECLREGIVPELAAGYVAGAAALVAAKYPDETPAQWKNRLLTTASRPQPDKKDGKLGWGIVQPYSALNFSNDATALGPSNNTVPTIDPETVMIPEPPPDYSARLYWTVGGTLGAAVALLLAVFMVGGLLRHRRAGSG
jgi:hypothetical protein